MKFEVKQPEFTPIVITLDTQEDIDFLVSLIGSTSSEERHFGIKDDRWMEFYTSTKDRVSNMKYFDIVLEDL